MVPRRPSDKPTSTLPQDLTAAGDETMTPRNRSTGQVPEPAKTRCPRCQSRLEVLETPSGGRIVSVAFLGVTVETTAAALEIFIPPDGGAEIRCPACDCQFDPAGPRRIPPLKRATT
jgi:DNA-directed RNA polymerase subunit RPC12/RpoP